MNKRDIRLLRLWLRGIIKDPLYFFLMEFIAVAISIPAFLFIITFAFT